MSRGNKADYIKKIHQLVQSGELNPVFEHFIEEICEGAMRGGDIKQFKSVEEWARWLSWSSTVIDRDDYFKAVIYALKLAPKLAATDYGTSRQRDLAQLWADAIRGFLGELAFVKWLKERFSIETELDYREGPLEEFIHSDIKTVYADNNPRPPKLRVSIKTTKLKGIWLDVPGAQIKHSDVYVLVRVGTTREHLLGFFKDISIIRDKLLSTALNSGIVDEEFADELWNEIPSFKPIPAYIAGFLDIRDLEASLKTKNVIHADGRLSRDRARRTIKKVVITEYLGHWDPNNRDLRDEALNLIESKLGIPRLPRDVSIEFEGIVQFSKTRHFIANSGMLKKKKSDWEEMLSEL